MRVCTDKCPKDLFGFQNKFCHSVCPDDYFADPISQTCVLRCPDKYLSDRINKKCVLECPQGILQQNRECVRLCEDALADYSIGVCTNSCSGIIFAGNCFIGGRHTKLNDSFNTWHFDLINCMLFLIFPTLIVLTFVV